MNSEQAIRAEIDNYNDSIFAIVGFMNFYRFDDTTRKIRNDVLVFQGRRLTPSKQTNAEGAAVEYVTPDLGVLLPTNHGVLAEVKRSFPKDHQHWHDDFQQLMAYDDDLTGWPTPSQKVPTHDIVLLLHQTRAVAVKDYYEQNPGGSLKFTRPFTIVEFNRDSEAQAFFFFRTITGAVSQKPLADRLRLGIPVPMTMYLLQYSTVKLYDAAPPLPCLLELIWTHVVAFKISNTQAYKMPAKKQKVKVEVTPDEISERLETNFSFHGLQQGHADGRQPKVLEKCWVRDACAALVKFGDATWTDTTKTKLIINFVKRENVLDYFVKQCARDPQNNGQMELFKAKGSGKPPPPAPGPPSQSAGQTNTTSP
jgi:hypothetical protein